GHKRKLGENAHRRGGAAGRNRPPQVHRAERRERRRARFW
ncbi:MAG: hypothetical protein AVDCRST_MAG01-01-3513, partial [uncultured Rubrobacteraceae bacterium]